MIKLCYLNSGESYKTFSFSVYIHDKCLNVISQNKNKAKPFFSEEVGRGEMEEENSVMEWFWNIDVLLVSKLMVISVYGKIHFSFYGWNIIIFFI